MAVAGRLRSGWSNLSGDLRGMVWMVLVTICWMSMQGGIRHLGGALPAFEVAFFRNLFGVLAVLPVFFTMGIGVFRTRRLPLHLARAFLQAFGMVAVFTALNLIPIANVTALSFSSPVIATVGAALILKETVRLRRWTAVICGFIGVLVVLRPGASEIELGHLLILGSSTTWAMCILMIRVLGRTESSATSTVYMALFMTAFTLVPALLVWKTPTIEQLVWLMGIGIIGTIGHLAFAQALRSAEATAVLPIDFLRLLWATLIGWIFFAEPPDFWTWAGGSIIFGSALYIGFREARLKQLRRTAPKNDIREER